MIRVYMMFMNYCCIWKFLGPLLITERSIQPLSDDSSAPREGITDCHDLLQPAVIYTVPEILHVLLGSNISAFLFTCHQNFVKISYNQPRACCIVMKISQVCLGQMFQIPIRLSIKACKSPSHIISLHDKTINKIRRGVV